MRHWLVARSKHSTIVKSLSLRRTTSPTTISPAGLSSRSPPPRPRVVPSRPWAASSTTTLVRWLCEMPCAWAISLIVTGLARPSLAAQYISTRKL
jgi:hypothetical protein